MKSEMEYHSYSEQFKLKIVKELEICGVRQIEIVRRYGIASSTLRGWLRKYGKNYRSKTVIRKYIGHVMMEDERDNRISDLESKLSDTEAKLAVYEKLIELAKKEYNIDIKKNYSSKVYEELGVKKDR
jgi:transposase